MGKQKTEAVEQNEHWSLLHTHQQEFSELQSLFIRRELINVPSSRNLLELDNKPVTTDSKETISKETICQIIRTDRTLTN
jgi:hypothetical protein